MLTELQQMHQLLEGSKHVLLVFGPDRNDDAVASVLALKLFLDKLGKRTDTVSHDFLAPKNLRFLPNLEEIKPHLNNLQKFIIKVDVSKAELENISYEVKDNWLSIFITPSQGIIGKNDLRTVQSNFKYDLIVTVGAVDLESLGDVFSTNTELFYRAPIVNIDYHAGNEHFGQVNLVDFTATSNAEIIYKTIEQLGSAYLDEKIASCLLAGMISQTHSFRAANVTPYTLNIASKLMNLGADRERIVQHLYRTRTVSTLKLWGAALSNLQNDKDTGLVWTIITRDDFVRSGATEHDLRDIAVELIGNSPEAKIILILHESDNLGVSVVRGQVVTDKNFDALEIAAPFRPKGNKKIATFEMEEKTLKDAEGEILEHFRSYIKTK